MCGLGSAGFGGFGGIFPLSDSEVRSDSASPSQLSAQLRRRGDAGHLPCDAPAGMSSQQDKDLLSHTSGGQQGHPSCHLAAISAVLAESFLIAPALSACPRSSSHFQDDTGRASKGRASLLLPFPFPSSSLSPYLPFIFRLCPSRKPSYQFRKVPPRARPFQLGCPVQNKDLLHPCPCTAEISPPKSISW